MKKTFLLLATIALICLSCSDDRHSNWSPGKVISDQQDADKALRVVVISGEAKGEYLIRLYEADTNPVVAEKKVLVPVGYHAPLIKVDWSQSPQRILVEFDHDFGEGNKVVELVGG